MSAFKFIRGEARAGIIPTVRHVARLTFHAAALLSLTLFAVLVAAMFTDVEVRPVKAWHGAGNLTIGIHRDVRPHDDFWEWQAGKVTIAGVPERIPGGWRWLTIVQLPAWQAIAMSATVPAAWLAWMTWRWTRRGRAQGQGFQVGRGGAGDGIPSPARHFPVFHDFTQPKDWE